MAVAPTPFVPVANTDTERVGDVGLISLLNGRVPKEVMGAHNKGCTDFLMRVVWMYRNLHERGGKSSTAQRTVLRGVLELQLTMKLKSSVTPLQLKERESKADIERSNTHSCAHCKPASVMRGCLYSSTCMNSCMCVCGCVCACVCTYTVCTCMW